MIRLGPQLCGSLDESSRREWLVTDGVGGYAMGTIAGLRTRRYHGLLVVAVSGPADRMLGLVALDRAAGGAENEVAPALDARVMDLQIRTCLATACADAPAAPAVDGHDHGVAGERDVRDA